MSSLDIVTYILLSICLVLALSSVLLCYKQSRGWYWFLIASVLLSMCGMSLNLSMTVLESVDMSQVLPMKDTKDE
jgi:hypothetical protein